MLSHYYCHIIVTLLLSHYCHIITVTLLLHKSSSQKISQKEGNDKPFSCCHIMLVLSWLFGEHEPEKIPGANKLDYNPFNMHKLYYAWERFLDALASLIWIMSVAKWDFLAWAWAMSMRGFFESKSAFNLFPSLLILPKKRRKC